MGWFCSARILACLALGSLCWMSSAKAQAPDDFFKGKTIRLVVGYGPGGGYDIYARMISPYLGKALGANVVVENQPGAGGITSLNRLYMSPPDGLTLSFANGTSAAFAQLTDQPGLRYDLARFDFLATVGAPPGLWLVGPEPGYTTIAEGLKVTRKWRWAASGPSDGLGNGAAFICEALKLDCQIVPGYSGSNQAALAVTKGEMDAVYIPESSANHFVKAKQNFALATIGRQKSRWCLDRPTISEAVKLDAEGTWLIDFLTGVEELGRVMILPPDMPKARLAFLQEVLREVLHDPQLIAEGERTERIIEYLGPQETLRNVQTIVSKVTPEQRARVQAIVSRK
jgi:tripartite-type tricarboxylate transporter receptor subunit TctC